MKWHELTLTSTENALSIWWERETVRSISLFFFFTHVFPVPVFSTHSHGKTERERWLRCYIWFFVPLMYRYIYMKNITFIYWISHQWAFLSLMHFRVVWGSFFFHCRSIYGWVGLQNPGEITFDEHMYSVHVHWIHNKK